jgi:hypothetical protein
MLSADDLQEIKKRKQGEYYKHCKNKFGKEEADRIIYKQVMGYYPEEAWLYGEEKS